MRRLAELRRGGDAALLLLPGVLVVLFGFSAGGYFAVTPALVAFELALVFVLWTLLADRPFAAVSRWGAVAAAALALLAVWQIVSVAWSNAPGRAFVDFNRTVLYLLTLMLFASMARRRTHVRRLIWSVAAGATVVCAAGLATRMLPDLFPTGLEYANDRLGYPVTYWNALGLLAAIGLVFCLHLTSSAREPAPVRVLAAAAVPILAPALLLTFSRGAIAAAALGVVVYMGVAHPRGMVTAALSAAPAGAVPVMVAYQSTAVAAGRATPAAVSEGHRLAAVVAVCAIAAALARWLLLRLDRRLETIHLDLRRRRAVTVGVAAACAAAVVSPLVAVGAPRAVERYYDGFFNEDAAQTEVVRERLTATTSSYRADTWRVALDAFEDRKLTGWGAGTYETLWLQHRPIDIKVVDAHSLYVETLGELGIVGVALLLVALAAIVVGVARRVRGDDRALYGAILASSVAWLFHAGIDWDWEMPVVTIGLFALGGAALASSPGRPPRRVRLSPMLRVAAVVAVLALAVPPMLLAVAQRRVDAAVEAFVAAECGRASSFARSASSLLPVMPEAYAIVGYCDAARGEGSDAIDAMEAAVAKDPRAWESRYGLAVVKASAGLDPRSDARAAMRLNPREPLTQDMVRRLDVTDRRTWAARAADTPVVIRPAASWTLELEHLRPRPRPLPAP